MAKRSEIAKMILTGVAAVGVVTVMATMPGLALALAPFVKNSSGKYSNRQINRSLRSLKKQGLISMTNHGDKILIKMTKNGKEKLLKFKIEGIKLKPQKRWDKTWRLVIFDIPESHKLNRQLFRRKIKEMGFERLQRSVWICPYPCEDEIDFLKEIYEIRPYVRIVTANSIDIQSDLVRRFNLA
jgi:DNA-binding transcriptional regulator PaaX